MPEDYGWLLVGYLPSGSIQSTRVSMLGKSVVLLPQFLNPLNPYSSKKKPLLS